MTPTRLAEIGRTLYGRGWQSRMADALGHRDGGRTVRFWAAGERPIPPGIAELLLHELRRHRDEIDRLLAA